MNSLFANLFDEFVVENILIEGLKQTDEQVVHRALTFNEGSTINQAKIDRSKERLMKLNIFDNIKLTKQENSNDVLISAIEKDLALTWFIWPLGGSLFGEATYWSLFNQGIILHAHVQPMDQVDLFYKWPILFYPGLYFKHAVSYFKLYRQSYGQIYYKDKNQSISNKLSFGKELIYNFYTEVDYKFTWTNWNEGASYPQQWHVMGLSLIWDDQDSQFYPKKGLYQRLTFKLNQLNQLNHHYPFYELDFISDYHQPVIGPLNISLKILAGLLNSVNDQYLPFQETIQVGGTDTIRGYFEGVRDNAYYTLKNQYYFIGSIELSWYILNSLRVFTFIEGGNSWYSREEFTNEPDFTKLVGTGLGLEWSILNSGYVVNFSLGYPLKSFYDDESQELLYHVNLTSALDKLFFK